jgi:hypothetical protein
MQKSRVDETITHSITQDALRLRASASALDADASLSLRPWITSTGKPAAPQHKGNQTAGHQTLPESTHAAAAWCSGLVFRTPGVQSTHQHSASVHCSCSQSGQPQPPTQHDAKLTLHDSLRIHPAQFVGPAGVQLALKAMGWLSRGACGCHVLPPQQLLAPR